MTETDTPARVFAKRLQQVRSARRWTQQELSERLDEMGHPMDRATIAQIESGARKSGVTRSDKVTLNEVVALSLAVGVAPIHMVIPLEDESPLQLVPGLPPEPALVARQWARGQRALGDEQIYLDQMPAKERQDRSGPPALKALQESMAALAEAFPPKSAENEADRVSAVQRVRAQLEVAEHHLKAVSGQMRIREAELIRNVQLSRVADPTLPATQPTSVGKSPAASWRNLKTDGGY